MEIWLLGLLWLVFLPIYGIVSFFRIGNLKRKVESLTSQLSQVVVGQQQELTDSQKEQTEIKENALETLKQKTSSHTQKIVEPEPEPEEQIVIIPKKEWNPLSLLWVGAGMVVIAVLAFALLNWNNFTQPIKLLLLVTINLVACGAWLLAKQVHKKISNSPIVATFSYIFVAIFAISGIGYWNFGVSQTNLLNFELFQALYFIPVVALVRYLYQLSTHSFLKYAYIIAIYLFGLTLGLGLFNDISGRIITLLILNHGLYYLAYLDPLGGKDLKQIGLGINTVLSIGLTYIIGQNLVLGTLPDSLMVSASIGLLLPIIFGVITTKLETKRGFNPVVQQGVVLFDIALKIVMLCALWIPTGTLRMWIVLFALLTYTASVEWFNKVKKLELLGSSLQGGIACVAWLISSVYSINLFNNSNENFVIAIVCLFASTASLIRISIKYKWYFVCGVLLATTVAVLSWSFRDISDTVIWILLNVFGVGALLVIKFGSKSKILKQATYGFASALIPTLIAHSLTLDYQLVSNSEQTKVLLYTLLQGVGLWCSTLLLASRSNNKLYHTIPQMIGTILILTSSVTVYGSVETISYSIIGLIVAYTAQALWFNSDTIAYKITLINLFVMLPLGAIMMYVSSLWLLIGAVLLLSVAALTWKTERAAWLMLAPIVLAISVFKSNLSSDVAYVLYNLILVGIGLVGTLKTEWLTQKLQELPKLYSYIYLIAAPLGLVLITSVFDVDTLLKLVITLVVCIPAFIFVARKQLLFLIVLQTWLAVASWLILKLFGASTIDISRLYPIVLTVLSTGMYKVLALLKIDTNLFVSKLEAASSFAIYPSTVLLLSTDLYWYGVIGSVFGYLAIMTNNWVSTWKYKEILHGLVLVPCFIIMSQNSITNVLWYGILAWIYSIGLTWWYSYKQNPNIANVSGLISLVITFVTTVPVAFVQDWTGVLATFVGLSQAIVVIVGPWRSNIIIALGGMLIALHLIIKFGFIFLLIPWYIYLFAFGAAIIGIGVWLYNKQQKK
jgi:hypothetical protein